MLGNEEDKERRKTVAFTVELDRSNGPLGKSYNSFSKKGISYDKKTVFTLKMPCKHKKPSYLYNN